MTKELDREMLLKLMDRANGYSNATLALHRMAFHSAISKSEYAKGVLDGVENTSYTSFMAGAKALYKILIQNEQTD